MENLVYSLLLCVYVIFSMRIIFKEQSNIVMPIILVICSSWFLFMEKIPDLTNRVILITVLLIVTLIVRYYAILIIQNSKQVNTRF